MTANYSSSSRSKWKEHMKWEAFWPQSSHCSIRGGTPCSKSFIQLLMTAKLNQRDVTASAPCQYTLKSKFFLASKMWSDVLTSKFLGLWNWFVHPPQIFGKTEHFTAIMGPLPQAISNRTRGCLSLDVSTSHFYCLLLLERGMQKYLLWYETCLLPKITQEDISVPFVNVFLTCE